MTGNEFAKHCFDEKQSALEEYFNSNSESMAAEKIRNLIKQGTEKNELYELIDLVLTESYYTLLLGIDGEASLGGIQQTFKLYDEEGTLLNECGEIEEGAAEYFLNE